MRREKDDLETRKPMKRKWNGKQIAALIGGVLLLAMYVATLVLALLAKPGESQMFMASIACTIFIPILLYVYLMFYKMWHKEDGVSARELKKMNKRLEHGEAPEKLIEELEEK